jgi:hypothetical protein
VHSNRLASLDFRIGWAGYEREWTASVRGRRLDLVIKIAGNRRLVAGCTSCGKS